MAISNIVTSLILCSAVQATGVAGGPGLLKFSGAMKASESMMMAKGWSPIAAKCGLHDFYPKISSEASEVVADCSVKGDIRGDLASLKQCLEECCAVDSCIGISARSTGAKLVQSFVYAHPDNSADSYMLHEISQMVLSAGDSSKSSAAADFSSDAFEMSSVMANARGFPPMAAQCGRHDFYGEIGTKARAAFIGECSINGDIRQDFHALQRCLNECCATDSCVGITSTAEGTKFVQSFAKAEVDETANSYMLNPKHRIEPKLNSKSASPHEVESETEKAEETLRRANADLERRIKELQRALKAEQEKQIVRADRMVQEGVDTWSTFFPKVVQGVEGVDLLRQDSVPMRQLWVRGSGSPDPHMLSTPRDDVKYVDVFTNVSTRPGRETVVFAYRKSECNDWNSLNPSELFTGNVMGAIRNSIPRGGVGIDIGACYGDTAVPIAALISDAVIAFEPNPKAFAVLDYNAQLNPALNIFRHRLAAAGDEHTTELNFSYSEEMCNGGVIRPWSSPKDVHNITFKATYIPTFLTKTYGAGIIDEISFIKIDCEGFDASIFKTLAPLLSRNHRIVVMLEWFDEFRDRNNGDFVHPEAQNLFDTVDEMGYIPYEPYSMQRIPTPESKHYAPDITLLRKGVEPWEPFTEQ